MCVVFHKLWFHCFSVTGLNSNVCELWGWYTLILWRDKFIDSNSIDCSSIREMSKAHKWRGKNSCLRKQSTLHDICNGYLRIDGGERWKSRKRKKTNTGTIRGFRGLVCLRTCETEIMVCAREMRADEIYLVHHFTYIPWN